MADHDTSPEAPDSEPTTLIEGENRESVKAYMETLGEIAKVTLEQWKENPLRTSQEGYKVLNVSFQESDFLDAEVCGQVQSLILTALSDELKNSPYGFHYTYDPDQQLYFISAIMNAETELGTEEEEHDYSATKAELRDDEEPKVSMEEITKRTEKFKAGLDAAIAKIDTLINQKVAYLSISESGTISDQSRQLAMQAHGVSELIELINNGIPDGDSHNQYMLAGMGKHQPSLIHVNMDDWYFSPEDTDKIVELYNQIICDVMGESEHDCICTLDPEFLHADPLAEDNETLSQPDTHTTTLVFPNAQDPADVMGELSAFDNQIEHMLREYIASGERSQSTQLQ